MALFGRDIVDVAEVLADHRVDQFVTYLGLFVQVSF